MIGLSSKIINTVNMKSKNQLKLGKLVSTALPKGGGFDLSKNQIQGLKRASEVALAIVAVAGIIAVSAAALNVFAALGQLHKMSKKFKSLSAKDKNKKIAQTFYYLKRSGLVKFKISGKELVLSLTNLGRSRLSKLSLNAVNVSKPARWNARWWMIAADIPTKHHRQGADLLRKKLKEMDFYSLQRTLWLHPFDPRREIEFIAKTFGVQNFITVMEISRLDKEDEAKLRRHFAKAGIL